MHESSISSRDQNWNSKRSVLEFYFHSLVCFNPCLRYFCPDARSTCLGLSSTNCGRLPPLPGMGIFFFCLYWGIPGKLEKKYTMTSAHRFSSCHGTNWILTEPKQICTKGIGKKTSVLPTVRWSALKFTLIHRAWWIMQLVSKCIMLSLYICIWYCRTISWTCTIAR